MAERTTAGQTTGPAVFSPDGSHTHTIPAAAPVLPTGAAPPVLPANTGIGVGAEAVAWAAAILAKLGAPVNQATTASMISWFAAEDNHAQTFGQRADGVGQNNPLDVTAMSGTFAGTTGSEPSGAGPGHPGNLDFDTPAHGVAAMAQVIQNYSAIHAALMSGRGLLGNPAIAGDLNTWSGGGYTTLN